MIENRRNYRGLILAAILLVAAAAVMPFDLDLARPFQTCWKSGLQGVAAYLGYLNVFEPFGHGLGIILVLVAIHQLDPARRWAIPRLAVCALAAGGVANLLKILVARTRPNDFAFDGTVWTTFGNWLPLIHADSTRQSFASAHTAAAAGFACALVWLYPQGRVFFPFLAILVGCQRIVSGAHFPSDVLVGAAAGCFVVQFFLHVGLLPNWLDRLESHWRS